MPDYPWFPPGRAYDVWLKRHVVDLGVPVGIDTFAPNEKDAPSLRAWWASIVRHAFSPGGLHTSLSGLRDAGLRPKLRRIKVPTLGMNRRCDQAVRFQAGEHLAQQIPGAVWRPFEGVDYLSFYGDRGSVIEAILEFAAR